MKIALHKDGRTASVLTEFWLDGQGFLTVENPDKTWSTWSAGNCNIFESVDIARNGQLGNRVAYDRKGNPMGVIESIHDDMVMINNCALQCPSRLRWPVTETFVKI